MNRRKELDLIRKLFDRCIDLLERKGRDYAGDLEQPAGNNFAALAQLQGLSERQAIWSQLAKHLLAIGNWSRGRALAVELIDHRIVDAINYLALMWSMSLREKSSPPTDPLPKRV